MTWCCSPPPTDGFASDEEVGDDDIGYAANIELPRDVAGTVELHRRLVESDSDTDEEDNPDGNNTKKR